MKSSVGFGAAVRSGSTRGRFGVRAPSGVALLRATSRVGRATHVHFEELRTTRYNAFPFNFMFVGIGFKLFCLVFVAKDSLWEN